MGLFSKIFKKKEGGTVIGNALRKVGDAVTGGAASALFPRPTAADVRAQAERRGEIAPASFDMRKKTDAWQAVSNPEFVVGDSRDNAQPTNWGKIIGIGAAIVAALGLAWKFMRGGKSKSKRRRY